MFFRTFKRLKNNFQRKANEVNKVTFVAYNLELIDCSAKQK